MSNPMTPPAADTLEAALEALEERPAGDMTGVEIRLLAVVRLLVEGMEEMGEFADDPAWMRRVARTTLTRAAEVMAGRVEPQR